MLDVLANKDCSVLIVDSNFGSGSSREHAVWATKQAGFNAVIARDTIADIYRNNCVSNAVAYAVLSEKDHDSLLKFIEDGMQRDSDWRPMVTISIEKLNITVDAPNCQLILKFDILPGHRDRFLMGRFDESKIILEEHEDAIRELEAKRPPVVCNA